MIRAENSWEAKVMMMWIAGLLAVLCLIYYIVILVYSGITTSFAFIWLIGSGFFFLVAAGIRYEHLHPRRLPLWLPVSAATLAITSLLIFCIVETLIFTSAVSHEVPNLDYLIVLGARVREDGISRSLQMRLDKAVSYSQNNPDTVLVLSGGKGDDEPMMECQAMYDYLLYNGVPKEQMVLETFSTSTVENIAYSKVVIDALEEEKRKEAEKKLKPIAPGPYSVVEDKPLQIGVLTSDFHVFRAKMIGKKWGLPGLYGIASDTDRILFPHFCVRECAAILKDKLMGNM